MKQGIIDTLEIVRLSPAAVLTCCLRSDVCSGASASIHQAYGTLKERWLKKKEFFAESLKEFFNNRQKMKRVVAAVIAIIVLGITAETVFQYNRFSVCRTIVNARRADIDQEMQRRTNLMPNLRKVVNKYVIHEQRVFRYLTDTTSLGFAASMQGSTFDLANPFEKTLSRMLFAWLMWPKLKATQSVQDLVREAASTEDRIAEAKMEYNKACQVYNQYRLTFPGNFFGFIFGFDFVPYLGAGEEIMGVPSLQLRVPVIISRPNGKIEDVDVAATDPISWLKAEFLKNQISGPEGKLMGK